MTELKKWKLSRARGVILEYMRGLKPRADLKWCIGCLTKSFCPSLSDIDILLESIEKDPTVIITPDSNKRLGLLKEELKKFDQTPRE
ncbi:hypothetical protein ES703_125014 [subsurface metagenome]